MQRKSFDGKVVDQAQNTQQHSWHCSAYGCRLPGGLSQGFGQEARYYCRFHYGKEPFENDGITKVLHNYGGLFDSIYAIKEVPDVQRIGNHLEANGRADLKPEQDEALLPQYYRDRLLKLVGQEVFNEIKRQKEARVIA
jgi:hypothetical protein